MSTFTVAVLAGDGIGAEVTTEATRVLRALSERSRHTFALREALVGQAAITVEGEAISDATVHLCTACDAVLFGAVGGGAAGDPSSRTQPEHALFRLRKELDLFANVRPVRALPRLARGAPFKRAVLRGVDLVVIRELTGGLYYGKPSAIRESAGGAAAIDTMVYAEGEIERVVRFAFELARTRRRSLTSVDKANVLSCSRLWRRITERVAREYPDVAVRHQLVDSCAMALLRQPRDFDVIVTENLFGDILTDEASMLAGSLGMLPSASLGTRMTAGGRFGLYEPIHGTAPDIAGQGTANPLAAILSVALLLRLSLGLPREAQMVERAVRQAISDGCRTADIAAPGEPILSTQQMGAEVVRRLTPSSRGAKGQAPPAAHSSPRAHV